MIGPPRPHGDGEPTRWYRLADSREVFMALNEVPYHCPLLPIWPRSATKLRQYVAMQPNEVSASWLEGQSSAGFWGAPVPPQGSQQLQQQQQLLHHATPWASFSSAVTEVRPAAATRPSRLQQQHAAQPPAPLQPAGGDYLVSPPPRPHQQQRQQPGLQPGQQQGGGESLPRTMEQAGGGGRVQYAAVGALASAPLASVPGAALQVLVPAALPETARQAEGSAARNRGGAEPVSWVNRSHRSAGGVVGAPAASSKRWDLTPAAAVAAVAAVEFGSESGVPHGPVRLPSFPAFGSSSLLLSQPGLQQQLVQQQQQRQQQLLRRQPQQLPSSNNTFTALHPTGRWLGTVPSAAVAPRGHATAPAVAMLDSYLPPDTNSIFAIQQWLLLVPDHSKTALEKAWQLSVRRATASAIMPAELDRGGRCWSATAQQQAPPRGVPVFDSTLAEPPQTSIPPQPPRQEHHHRHQRPPPLQSAGQQMQVMSYHYHQVGTTPTPELVLQYTNELYGDKWDKHPVEQLPPPTAAQQRQGRLLPPWPVFYTVPAASTAGAAIAIPAGGVYSSASATKFPGGTQRLHNLYNQLLGQAPSPPSGQQDMLRLADYPGPVNPQQQGAPSTGTVTAQRPAVLAQLPPMPDLAEHVAHAAAGHGACPPPPTQMAQNAPMAAICQAAWAAQRAAKHSDGHPVAVLAAPTDPAGLVDGQKESVRNRHKSYASMNAVAATAGSANYAAADEFRSMVQQLPSPSPRWQDRRRMESVLAPVFVVDLDSAQVDITYVQRQGRCEAETQTYTRGGRRILTAAAGSETGSSAVGSGSDGDLDAEASSGLLDTSDDAMDGRSSSAMSSTTDARDQEVAPAAAGRIGRLLRRMNIFRWWHPKRSGGKHPPGDSSGQGGDHLLSSLAQGADGSYGYDSDGSSDTDGDTQQQDAAAVDGAEAYTAAAMKGVQPASDLAEMVAASSSQRDSRAAQPHQKQPHFKTSKQRKLSVAKRSKPRAKAEQPAAAAPLMADVSGLETALISRAHVAHDDKPGKKARKMAKGTALKTTESTSVYDNTSADSGAAQLGAAAPTDGDGSMEEISDASVAGASASTASRKGKNAKRKAGKGFVSKLNFWRKARDSTPSKSARPSSSGRHRAKTAAAATTATDPGSAEELADEGQALEHQQQEQELASGGKDDAGSVNSVPAGPADRRKEMASKAKTKSAGKAARAAKQASNKKATWRDGARGARKDSTVGNNGAPSGAGRDGDEDEGATPRMPAATGANEGLAADSSKKEGQSSSGIHGATGGGWMQRLHKKLVWHRKRKQSTSAAMATDPGHDQQWSVKLGENVSRGSKLTGKLNKRQQKQQVPSDMPASAAATATSSTTGPGPGECLTVCASVDVSSDEPSDRVQQLIRPPSGAADDNTAARLNTLKPAGDQDGDDQNSASVQAKKKLSLAGHLSKSLFGRHSRHPAASSTSGSKSSPAQVSGSTGDGGQQLDTMAQGSEKKQQVAGQGNGNSNADGKGSKRKGNNGALGSWLTKNVFGRRPAASSADTATAIPAETALVSSTAATADGSATGQLPDAAAQQGPQQEQAGREGTEQGSSSAAAIPGKGSKSKGKPSFGDRLSQVFFGRHPARSSTTATTVKSSTTTPTPAIDAAAGEGTGPTSSNNGPSHIGQGSALERVVDAGPRKVNQQEQGSQAASFLVAAAGVVAAGSELVVRGSSVDPPQQQPGGADNEIEAVEPAAEREEESPIPEPAAPWTKGEGAKGAGKKSAGSKLARKKTSPAASVSAMPPPKGPKAKLMQNLLKLSNAVNAQRAATTNKADPTTNDSSPDTDNEVVGEEVKVVTPRPVGATTTATIGDEMSSLPQQWVSVQKPESLPAGTQQHTQQPIATESVLGASIRSKPGALERLMNTLKSNRARSKGIQDAAAGSNSAFSSPPVAGGDDGGGDNDDDDDDDRGGAAFSPAAAVPPSEYSESAAAGAMWGTQRNQSLPRAAQNETIGSLSSQKSGSKGTVMERLMASLRRPKHQTEVQEMVSFKEVQDPKGFGTMTRAAATSASPARGQGAAATANGQQQEDVAFADAVQPTASSIPSSQGQKSSPTRSPIATARLQDEGQNNWNRRLNSTTRSDLNATTGGGGAGRQQHQQARPGEDLMSSIRNQQAARSFELQPERNAPNTHTRKSAAAAAAGNTSAAAGGWEVQTARSAQSGRSSGGGLVGTSAGSSSPLKQSLLQSTRSKTATIVRGLGVDSSPAVSPLTSLREQGEGAGTASAAGPDPGSATAVMANHLADLGLPPSKW